MKETPVKITHQTTSQIILEKAELLDLVRDEPDPNRTGKEIVQEIVGYRAEQGRALCQRETGKPCSMDYKVHRISPDTVTKFGAIVTLSCKECANGIGVSITHGSALTAISQEVQDSVHQ
jgi:hypothetical protein